MQCLKSTRMPGMVIARTPPTSTSTQVPPVSAFKVHPTAPDVWCIGCRDTLHETYVLADDVGVSTLAFKRCRLLVRRSRTCGAKRATVHLQVSWVPGRRLSSRHELERLHHLLGNSMDTPAPSDQRRILTTDIDAQAMGNLVHGHSYTSFEKV